MVIFKAPSELLLKLKPRIFLEIIKLRRLKRVTCQFLSPRAESLLIVSKLNRERSLEDSV